MKITIVNCGHDRNRGVAAIHIGLLRLLKSLSPERIVAISSFPENHPGFSTSLHYVHQLFPHVELVGHPLPATYQNRWGKLRGMLQLEFWIRLGMFPQHLALKTIAESDLIITRSSPLFSARGRVLNYSLSRAALLLFIARRLGKPYGFAPECFAPLSSWQGKSLLRSLLQNASFVFARDWYSFSELYRLGFEVKVMLDTGFWIEPVLSDSVLLAMKHWGLEKGRFLIVTVREVGSNTEATLRAIARAVQAVVPRLWSKVVLIPNAFDPMGQVPDDLKVTEMLRKLLSETTVVTEDWGPEELAGFYSQAGAVMGMRVHSLILALRVGIPVIGIDIDGRARGILKTFWLEDQAISLPEILAGQGEQLVEALKRAATLDMEPICSMIEFLRMEGKRRFLEAIQTAITKGSCL